MKNESNWEALAGSLGQLEPTRPGRPKIMAGRLEGIREALLKARAKGVSFRALSRLFRENGKPVSDFTLRRYVGEWTGEGRKRRKRKVRSSQVKTAPVATQEPTPEARKLPPRLAHRLKFNEEKKQASEPLPSWKKPLSPEERKLPPRLGRKNPLMD